MAMRFGIEARRASLDGLARILDAGALEDLFTGPDDDAAFMYDLLVEVARGRSSACYWEICHMARRRGVSPEYVVDRAAVLVGSIDERRRIDAYRILGVEGLASPEAIRHRWLEFAKTGHPDVGGDGTRFRRVKDAYELLRDPQRRGEYERYWLRALGPFERVVPRDEDPERTARREGGGRRLAMVGKRGTLVLEPPLEAPAVPEPTEVVAVVVPVPTGTSEPATLAHALGRVRSIVHEIDAVELAETQAHVAREIERLEALQHHLARLLIAKRVFPA